MNSYKQEYANLNNSIDEKLEKIKLLNEELEKVTELESQARIGLYNEEYELSLLKHKKNKAISKKDKLISIPMKILLILIEVFLLSSISNIIMLPEEALFKILVGCVTLPIGACTCIAAILGSNELTRKLQSKLHEHMAKNSSEYKEISEEIKNVNISLEPKKIESERLKAKVSEIKSMISQTKESINFDLEKLENLKNEIINMVISEKEPNQENIKPNIRVRSKLN